MVLREVLGVAGVLLGGRLAPKDVDLVLLMDVLLDREHLLAMVESLLHRDDLPHIRAPGVQAVVVSIQLFVSRHC